MTKASQGPVRPKRICRAFLPPGPPAALTGTAGFTLFELLIALVLMGIAFSGLYQTFGTGLAAYDHTRKEQALVARSRFAMERLVRFVADTDYLFDPASDAPVERLEVSERLLDTRNNATLAYVAAGDGRPDADMDGDGRVNEDAGLPESRVLFALDKTDGTNWKLTETLPDYATAIATDTQPPRVVIDHVTAFACTRMGLNVVDIRLSVADGDRTIDLHTRVRAVRFDPGLW
ncbi:MAG: prepilin-type N-terminal cleavage/methylation domain-containing protein [Desulfobacterales bacterium]|nr:prepilin-type N-terminal cleavage/methylation domain-containing protein [Desulfobacterales bacterium]